MHLIPVNRKVVGKIKHYTLPKIRRKKKKWKREERYSSGKQIPLIWNLSYISLKGMHFLIKFCLGATIAVLIGQLIYIIISGSGHFWTNCGNHNKTRNNKLIMQLSFHTFVDPTQWDECNYKEYIWLTIV